MRTTMTCGLLAIFVVATVSDCRSVLRKTACDECNVLLVTMDTVRADHLPCYGYDEETSPNVCALAEEGVLFTNAVSSSSWTLPAHASILTGLYPNEHQAEKRLSQLKPRRPRLARILKREGYATGAIVSARFVGSDHGFANGFTDFDDSLVERGIRNRFAIDITDKAITWVDRQEPPFFLWLHYYDPHHAFLYHRDGFSYPVDGLEDQELDYTGWNEIPATALDRVREHSDVFKTLYDGEIHFTDGQIGRFLDYLKQTGRFDRTLVVVTSDHGEAFGDHGLVGHDNFLYQELIRVPLVLRVPGQESPAVVESVQETRDIFHTVLALLGVDSGSASGYNLLTDTREYAYSEVDNRNKDKRVAVVSDRWKLIYTFDATVELYDLVNDPREERNVAPDHPEVVRPLLERLSEEMGFVLMDDEALEQLRALGYAN